MNETESLRYIADFYGEEPQTRQLVEECAEVIQAVSKLWRGKPNASEHLAEEIADVEICLAQVKYLRNLEEQVQDFKAHKIAREFRRIRGESDD